MACSSWTAKAGGTGWSIESMGLINLQETERTGGNGAWETTESLGDVREEERRAYEMAAQEEDGMDGDDDNFVRMQPQPTATTSTVAVPSDESFKGPMSAGPVLSQNVFSQQQRVQQQQQQVPSVPQRNFARASNSANSFDMLIHAGLASGIQATYEPSGHQHGVSRASLAHSDSQTRPSRALLDTRTSWSLLVGSELGGTRQCRWDCTANSSNNKSRRHSGNRALEVDRVRPLQFLLMAPEVRWVESRSSCSNSSSTVSLTNRRCTRWTKTRTT
jgi:hypothetical protein